MLLKTLVFLAAIGVPGTPAQTPTPKLARVCLIDIHAHPVADMPLFARQNGDAEIARTGADGCTSINLSAVPKTLWVTGVQTWLDRQFRVPLQAQRAASSSSMMEITASIPCRRVG